MEWSNIYRGLIMGISDLIPGVSGGTIAVVLGIYDRLLEAISGLFSKEWRRHIGFVLPLAVGMGTALLVLSRAIQYLLDYHYVPTQYFFLGLIIGVLPLLVRRVDAKRNLTSRHMTVLLVAAALVASMAFLNPEGPTEPIMTLTVLRAIGLFLSGWFASMAMLLPGISGSFVLLVIGVYPTAIHALSSLNVPVIATLGAGVAVGFIVSSKAIRYVLTHYPHMTYSVIIGLIVGSIFVVFPGFAGLSTMFVSVITFVLGLGLTTLFGARGR